MSAHALYRFYGDDGHLLYVGITASPSGRFKQHGQDKNWWPEVRGISVEWYDDRPAVLAAEARAINVENPNYNIQRPTRRRGPSSPPPTPQHLTWTCDYCDKPIANDTGYIYIDSRELHETERAVAAWDAANPGPVIHGPALMTYPEGAPWRHAHHECDPEPESEAYGIGVHRARTHAQLLDWTSHLLGKRWLKHTDWHDLIARAAGVDA